MRRWWRTRSTRFRIVASAAVPLALALIVGTIAVGAVFAHSRVEELDRQTRTEVDVLRDLVVSGQRPRTLPLPASSTLLAQVLNGEGDVLSFSPSASSVQPLSSSSRSGVVNDETGAYAGAPLRVRTLVVSTEGQRFVLVVAAPLGDVRRALHALTTVLLLVVPVLVLLTTLVIWWATGLALRPLAALADRQRTFIADAAHELRSPITSLVVQLDVAAAHPAGVDPSSLLADLRADVQRLSTLADDLLLLARLEDVPLRLELLDLRELLGLPGPSVQVRGDATSLRQLLLNLTTNAHRYATRVEVRLEEAPGLVHLVVDDDGPGIPPSEREHVFERWVRLDQGRSRSEGGSGLGLSLVRAIALAHGGSVRVSESPLGGARFVVSLPTADR